MDNEIRTLEKMRDDLLRQVSALDLSIRTLQQIRADLTLTDQAPEVMPSEPVSTHHRTRRKKATTLTAEQLAAVPDYNPGRGGIRIDD